MAEPPGRDEDRPLALLTYRYFSPRHDAQGPTQSLIRLVQALGHLYRFKIVSMAMPGEAEERWEQAFGIDRIGVAGGLRGLLQLWRILRQTPSRLLVLNSFFDPQLTIAVLAMRKLRLIPRQPVMIAPRGEFSPGALAIKADRKRNYLRIARWFGLIRGVSFQATDPLEAEAIRRELPHAGPILLAPNLRMVEPAPERRSREAGEPVRFVFLSRIDRKKNLDLALRLLADSGARARFDIIGPVHDPAYWAECQALAGAMPESVTVRYAGAVPADEVLQTLAAYDVMLFPTAGENYGHVLVESFLAGTPVLVSDQTPWLELPDARAGADIPLTDREAWLEWIRRFAAMSDRELATWRTGARAYAERSLRPDEDVERLVACFEAVLDGQPAPPADASPTPLS